MSIRGFGPVLVANLLGWKHQMVAQFRFDPKKGVPESDLMALTQKYKQQQDLLRAHLEQGAVELQGLCRRSRGQLSALTGHIRRCVIDVAQAEADAAALAGRWWGS
jgi:DNA-binding helix-hairpin-helix protein with protein kinase domain